jgi:carboxylesterase type B
MNLVVETQPGKMRGSVADGINTFKGIPYAAPPFGANRLRPHSQLSRGAACETLSPMARRYPRCRLIQDQLELRADLTAHPDPERWGEEVVVSMMLWQPVIDGDAIPARPIHRIAAGAGAEIDLMAGATTDEWRFFLVPNDVIEHITDDVLARAVAAYGLRLKRR